MSRARRRPERSRPARGGRWAWSRSLIGAAWLALVPVAAANAPAWWTAVPSAAPTPTPVPEARWYDALDVDVRLSASSAGPDLRAGVVVRVRLDAEAYLARLTAEAEDLAVLNDTLVRERHQQAQLRWLANRCEAAWRGWQRDLLDAVLHEMSSSPAQPGVSAGVGLSSAEAATANVASLVVLRELVHIGAGHAATAADVRACRLEGVQPRLALAATHPALAARAAERRLDERANALLDAPLPPVVWFDADARTDAFGAAAGVRVGLDLPLAWPGAALEVVADTTGRSLGATLTYQRYGAAARPRPTPPADATADDDALAGHLQEQLRLRQLEAELLGIEARQQWVSACGDHAAAVLPLCLARNLANRAALDRLLLAIDSERAAIGAALAAIEASGQDVARLLQLPPASPEEAAAEVP